MEPTRREIVKINTYTNHESFPENFAYEVQYAYVFEHEGKTMKSVFFAQLNTDDPDNWILWERLSERIIWSWIPEEELAKTEEVAIQQAETKFFPKHTSHETFPWNDD